MVPFVTGTSPRLYIKLNFMNFPRYYRRDGTPYPEGEKGLLEWAKDFENPKDCIVKQDHINQYFISTIWIGLNQSFNVGSETLPSLREE